VRRRATIIAGILVSGAVLAGCATGAGAAGAGAEGAAPPEPTPQQSATSAAGAEEDAAAVAKAEAWLEGAVLPPGAERSETPTAAFLSYYQWWCSPMVERTGYWTLQGASVVETRNWLSAHPTADLIATSDVPSAEDPAVTESNIGNVPFRGSLEGIAYTVTRIGGGVGIRAEIGVVPDNAVCPTPEPGVMLGGPGEG